MDTLLTDYARTSFSRRKEMFLLLFMAFATLGLYYPAILAPFCFVDDRTFVNWLLNNPWSLASWLKGMFDLTGSGGGSGPYFRPLTGLVFHLVSGVAGLEPEPFHLLNVLVHLGSGLLVYYIVKKIHGTTTWTIWLGFFAAMIFLLHPVNVEAVAWVSGLAAVLSTFFILLSFVFHLGVKRDLKDWHLWAAAFCYLLSLFTYELALAMPLAFLYWDLDRNLHKGFLQAIRAGCRRWLVYGGVLTVYVIYRALRGMTEPGSGREGGYFVISLVDALLDNFWNPFIAIGFYLKKLFWPWPLSFYIADVPSAMRPVYVLLGVTYLTAVVWWIWRRTWARFWASWFICGLLVPLLLSFRSFSWTPLAERYVYLSSIAFAVSLSLLLSRLITTEPRWAARAAEIVLITLLFAFGIGTTVRATVWQSSVALLRDAWEQNSFSGRLTCYYADVLWEAGRTEESIRLWKKAMELGFVSEPAQALGNVENGKKKYVAAERYYLQALWPLGKLQEPGPKQAVMGLLHKRDPEIYLKLADLHYKMAEEAPARMKYHKERIIHFHDAACKLEPGNVYLRYLLAKAHLRLGNLDAARQEFAQVSESTPDTYYGKAAAKLARRAGRGVGKEHERFDEDIRDPSGWEDRDGKHGSRI